MKRKPVMRDPVCGQRVNRNKTHIMLKYEGHEYPLCCPKCQSEFEKTPEKYLTHMKRH